jgi:hypothetical protein
MRVLAWGVHRCTCALIHQCVWMWQLRPLLALPGKLYSSTNW